MFRRFSWGSVLKLLTIFAISFVVFLLLLPNFEQSRSEARVSMTYQKVRELQEKYQDQPPLPMGSKIELAEKDPWQRPYVLQSFAEEGRIRLRVVSEGDSPETEEDDISSDMPTSPMLPFQERKNRQFLKATLIAGGTWLVLTAAYFVRHLPHLESEDSNLNPPT